MEWKGKALLFALHPVSESHFKSLLFTFTLSFLSSLKTVHLCFSYSIHSLIVSPTILSLLVKMVNPILLAVFATVAAFSVVGVGGLNTESIQRSKRGILDTIACTPKLISAAQSCSEDLDERTKGYDRENADEAAKCCIYTDFRRCVRSVAQRECGSDTGESVDSAIRTVQSALSDKVSLSR